MDGSARYCWYISSTSHSLVPKPATEEEFVEDGRDGFTLDTGSSAFFVCGRFRTGWRVYARGLATSLRNQEHRRVRRPCCRGPRRAREAWGAAGSLFGGAVRHQQL